MTRGAELNQVFVFTRPAEIPDPAPGTGPAPELARHEQLERERGGHQPIPAARRPEPSRRDARAVLRDVLDRGTGDESATTTLRRALADADHLAGLHAIWEGETAGLRRERYRSCVAAALPAGRDPAELDTPQATWLWRTLRAAETAGLDITAVVRAGGQRAVARRRPGPRLRPGLAHPPRHRPGNPCPPLPWSARSRPAAGTGSATSPRSPPPWTTGRPASASSPPSTPPPGPPQPSDRFPMTRSTGSTGRPAPLTSAPTASSTDGTTTPSPSAQNPPATPPRKEPPGTPPGPPSPGPTSTTCPAPRRSTPSHARHLCRRDSLGATARRRRTPTGTGRRPRHANRHYAVNRRG